MHERYHETCEARLSLVGRLSVRAQAKQDLEHEMILSFSWLTWESSFAAEKKRA